MEDERWATRAQRLPKTGMKKEVENFSPPQNGLKEGGGGDGEVKKDFHERMGKSGRKHRIL